MKKFSRKLLGICLAASLAITAVPPTRGMAAQGGEDVYAGQAEQPDGTDTGTDVPAAESGEVPGRERETEEQKPEGDMQATAEEPETEMQKTEEGIEQPTQKPGMEDAEDEMVTGEQDAQDVRGMVVGEIYDVNQPVIESFEFAEKGQELTRDDTLHFCVSTYDADSGIRSVVITISSRGGSDSFAVCDKSENGNMYIGTYPCDKLEGTNFYISRVRVTDMSGNYTDWNVKENGDYIYKFSADCHNENESVKDDNVSFSDLSVQKSDADADADGKLSVNDTVTYSVSVSCKNETIKSAEMCLTAYADRYWVESVAMIYDTNIQKLTGTYVVTDKTYPAEWSLNYISVETESGKYYTMHPETAFPDMDVKFIVVQHEYDTEKPVIESITVDKNGQFVTTGDIINITVKVKDTNPSKTASVCFSPMISNVSVDDVYVALELNEDTGAYVGKIVIAEDTYPCEWALTELRVSDEIGHETKVTEKDIGSTYPWYYKVKMKNVYAEDVKDVTLSFYAVAKRQDGTIGPALVCSNEVKNVGRRASLKELGVSFPQTMEGIEVKGWKYNDSAYMVDENTQLLFEGNHARIFEACYDKGCANISLNYITQSGEKKTILTTKFVDKELSYRDVLDQLELPEDARSDDFAGYRLTYQDGSHSMETVVREYGYISAEATYSRNQVACATKYFDEEGNMLTGYTVKGYPSGTKISEVLSDLEKPAPVNGVEFEKWVVPGFSGDENDEIDQGMMRLDVAAVYCGKTTADISYVHRGEDGRMISGSRMVLVDGEDPTDAGVLGQCSDVFKNVNHFPGLKLLEWTGCITLKQERYRTVEFTAKYNHYVVELRYPDNTCEYIVVERGTLFTLPAETEKYKNIVWEGYDAGASVTVIEDMCFVVADAEQKEEEAPPETTGDVRLSEEEIEEIVKKVREAADGETVRVDMKKATVIPKEVLEAIRDRSVAVVLDMGTYNWTVNGLDVLATEQRDIDLEVKVDTDAVPPGLVQELAGDSPATQLSLTHNGDFGFQASLGLNLGSGHAGETGNLYYYDSTGRLVFVNSGEIAEDGTINLPFSHASDYVIVIETEKMLQEPVFPSDDADDRNGEGTAIRTKEDGLTEIGPAAGGPEPVGDGRTEPDDIMGRKTDGRRMRSPKTGE